jgi:hypothetical protein
VTAPDPLKGYKGRARARLELFGVRVWSDVRATNDAGSVFEGVILPRSETLDDEHVVVKLKTGYNVGCVERPDDDGGCCGERYHIPESLRPAARWVTPLAQAARSPRASTTAREP